MYTVYRMGRGHSYLAFRLSVFSENLFYFKLHFYVNYKQAYKFITKKLNLISSCWFIEKSKYTTD